MASDPPPLPEPNCAPFTMPPLMKASRLPRACSFFSLLSKNAGRAFKGSGLVKQLNVGLAVQS